MKPRAVMGLMLGVIFFAVVVATHDIGAVANAFSAAGWNLSWVLVWRILSIFCSGAAWYCLFWRSAKPSYPFLVFGRWISEAVNHLLPALQVGGDVVRARLAYLLGRRRGLALPGVRVAAIQVTDVTCAFTAQVILVSIGFLQLWQLGAFSLLIALFGIVLILVPLALLLMVQRREVLKGATGILGHIGLEHFLQSIAETSDNLADQFRALYIRRRALVLALAWHIIAGLLRVGETWSALWVFGHPVSLADAFLVDVMTGAVRSLVFFIPGALGAQESGILLIASVVGIDPSVALALALAKRARDLVLGLPGLAAWFASERVFMARSNAVADR